MQEVLFRIQGFPFTIEIQVASMVDTTLLLAPVTHLFSLGSPVPHELAHYCVDLILKTSSFFDWIFLWVLDTVLLWAKGAAHDANTLQETEVILVLVDFRGIRLVSIFICYHCFALFDGLWFYDTDLWCTRRDYILFFVATYLFLGEARVFPKNVLLCPPMLRVGFFC